jgi:NAD(P)-dependent dehydrogenase (short-subunit alcohol dehydrogenase family)
MTYSLEGRAAIITGANQGLGLAIARSYIAAGADILICARDGFRLEQARSELVQLAKPGRKIEIQAADVSKRADVDRLVAEALEIFPHLQILVNNAGIYGPKGPIEDVNWEEWVKAIEINLLGSVLMCRAILPHFRAQRYGKIVQLSGGGATNPLPRISAYAASKAAVVRFVETLAEEVADDHIDVNAIAPGALNTRLLDEVLAAGQEKVGQDFYNRALKQKKQGGTPLEKGADLAVFLAAAESDGITGRLISAVWDPWQALPEHMENLRRTDIYTLRRIVPKDRGLNWGEQ